MQNVLEFSNSRGVEYRVDDRKLVGYAAVFFNEDDQGTVFSPFDGHTEIIASTAFDEARPRLLLLPRARRCRGSSQLRD